MSFHTSVTGTSVFSPTPNAFMGQTPALMIRRLAKPAAGSFTAIRLFCEIKQKNVNICLLFSGPYSHYTGGNLNLTLTPNPNLLCERIKCFSSTLRRRNLKMQQSPVSVDLCLRQSRSGKTRDCYDFMAFENLRFKMFSVHTISKTQSRCFEVPPV